MVGFSTDSRNESTRSTDSWLEPGQRHGQSPETAVRDRRRPSPVCQLKMVGCLWLRCKSIHCCLTQSEPGKGSPVPIGTSPLPLSDLLPASCVPAMDLTWRRRGPKPAPGGSLRFDGPSPSKVGENDITFVSFFHTGRRAVPKSMIALGATDSAARRRSGSSRGETNSGLSASTSLELRNNATMTSTEIQMTACCSSVNQETIKNVPANRECDAGSRAHCVTFQ